LVIAPSRLFDVQHSSQLEANTASAPMAPMKPMEEEGAVVKVKRAVKAVKEEGPVVEKEWPVKEPVMFPPVHVRYQAGGFA
jgi:hypothetical protein